MLTSIRRVTSQLTKLALAAGNWMHEIAGVFGVQSVCDAEGLLQDSQHDYRALRTSG